MAGESIKERMKAPIKEYFIFSKRFILTITLFWIMIIFSVSYLRSVKTASGAMPDIGDGWVMLLIGYTVAWLAPDMFIKVINKIAEAKLGSGGGK